MLMTLLNFNKPLCGSQPLGGVARIWQLDSIAILLAIKQVSLFHAKFVLADLIL